MIRQEIIDYVEREILPLYNSFDRAHSVDHATTVIAESAALATHYDVDCEMVYLVAAFHDTGLCEGRERHHIVSGEILLFDEFVASLFSEEQRIVMREAIEDHRASSKGEPRSIYGQIVAEADRVISTDITLRRTVQYGLKHLESRECEVHFTRFCEHLEAKYAEGGYLKLYIPYSDNAERLSQLRAVIADKRELRSRFDAIFFEELSLDE